MQNQRENEIRCAKCNKLLARATRADMTIKCPRCKHLNRIKWPVNHL